MTAASLSREADPFLLLLSWAKETRLADREPSVVDDLQDIGHCQSGQSQYYRRIVERHERHVAGMMWRFSKDPETHEELVQDVFVEAYVSLSSYRGEAPFAHWLSRIATRVGYRFWKIRNRQRKERETLIESGKQLCLQEPEGLSPEDAGIALESLMARLSARDQLVLTLRYLEDNTVEETAYLTGWSVALVKVQAWRAKARLRKLIERIRKGKGK